MLIMTIGPLPDAMKPRIHCAKTHWIRGFMTFQLAQHARTVTLMVSVRPESGFRERGARLPPINETALRL
jgi:hypothetical protein